MVRSLPTRSDHLRHPRFSARPGSFCFRLQMYVFFRFVVFSKITIFRKIVDFFIIFPKNASFFQHTHRFYTLFSENRPIFSCTIRKIANFRKFKNTRIFRSKFNYSTTQPHSIRNRCRYQTKALPLADHCYFINNFLVQCPIFSIFTRSKRHLSNTNL